MSSLLVRIVTAVADAPVPVVATAVGGMDCSGCHGARALNVGTLHVSIEQPELHLHPALQAELGDVFIESALGERKNTFILETHSEHLILRIMRRMRETHRRRLRPGLPPVRPEHVSVVYVERNGDRSAIREMPVNERGELVKAWPGGFFEEGLREMLP